MHLKYLEIQGFKSFAQKVGLEFPKIQAEDKGITAIVGPNGSGKSNTSDAIRWVLGEQSVKSLRGKKSSDLIFSGSKQRAQLGFAEVSLHLDNTDRVAPIEYDDIVITRRVYRDGDSEYILNKQPVRLTDIVLLLAKAKFAQKTYSVIGQGMIDSILTAPPTERKEFFDEAAGVREFQLKRDQSLNKLKNTQINLQQVDIILQEIEPRLRSLTRQVKRLERRESIEQELQEAQIQYFSSILTEIENKIKEFTGQSQTLTPQIAELQKELADNQKKLDQASQDAGRGELFATLQNELNNLVRQKNNLLREQAVLKGKLDVEYAKSGQLNLVWLEKRKDEVVHRTQDLEQQLKNKKSTEQAEEGLKIKKDKLQKIEIEIDRYRGQIEELRLGGDKIGDDQVKDFLREIFEMQKNFVADFKQAQTLEDLVKFKQQAQAIYDKIAYLRDQFVLARDTQTIATQIEQIQNSMKLLQVEKSDLLSEINELNVNIKITKEKNILLERELEREKLELIKIEAEVAQGNVKSGSEEEKIQIKEQNDQINQKLVELETVINQAQAKVDDFNNEEERKKIFLIQLQREYSAKQNQLASLNNRLNEINLSLTRYTTRKEDVLVDAKNNLNNLDLIIKDFTETVNRDLLHNKIQQLKQQLEMIGGIDQEVINEYNQLKDRFEFLNSQAEDLKKALKSLEEVITELDITIVKEFNASFNKINKEFDKYFKILFDGGSAKLVKITQEQSQAEEKTEKELAIMEIEQQQVGTELADQDQKIADDIYKKFKKINIYAGVDIQAMPPNKKVNHISMLSGGERALTAIALVCAIISCNPSPFVVLDEVDAALDEANSERFAAILHELSHKTQFIVITHNRSTMHQAKILYGVTMGEDGVSRLLSVKLEDAERMEKEGSVKMV